jgi:hypothetical protein
LIRAIVLVLAVGVGDATLAHAAGPWRAQIVDAATGQPLEGVIVVAIWKTERTGIRMHAARDFFDVDEIVTGVDGRAAIPERSLFSWRRFSPVFGPELIVFKPGYGVWDFRDVAKERPRLDPTSEREAVEREWKRLGKDEVVIVLPPLRTWCDRQRFVDSLDCCPAPPERIPRFTDVLNAERHSHGYQRYR